MRRLLLPALRLCLLPLLLTTGACGDDGDSDGRGQGNLNGQSGDPASARAPHAGRNDPASPATSPDPGSPSTPPGRPDPTAGDGGVATADAGAPSSDAGTPVDPCQSPQAARDPACQPSGCNGDNCPCSVTLQNCASPTDRCYPGGPAASDGQCYAAGAAGLGQPCVEPPVDTPAACGKGLLCLYADDQASEGSCMAICATSQDCPSGSSCHALNLSDNGDPSGDWGICAVNPPPPPPPPCDAFAQDCASPAQSCLPQSAGDNVCVTAGAGEVGADCDAVTGCAHGLVCAGLAGSTPDLFYFSIDPIYISRGGVCLALCRPGADCDSATACSAISSAFDGSARGDVGVCYGAVSTRP